MTKQITTVGLKKFLDQTVEQHRGYKYTDFEKQLKAGMSIAALAKMFGVSRVTIYNWLAHYEGEKGRGGGNL
jgi:transposase